MNQSVHKFLFCCLLCTIACQPVDSPKLTHEDYSVYAAYLDHFSLYKNVPPVPVISIDDSTLSTTDDIRPETNWTWVKTKLAYRCNQLQDTVQCRKLNDPQWSPLFDRFKQLSQGKQTNLVPSSFGVGYSLDLLSQFRKRLPKTQESNSTVHYIFRVSRVAYNADTTKALFFGRFWCGGTCGRGELIMLEKVDHSWTLIDTFMFWIS